ARAFAGRPGPGRAAGRVAGSEVRGDSERAHAQFLAVGDLPHVLQGREVVVLPPERELRILCRGTAAFERAPGGRARGNLRTAGPLQGRDTAGVVVVRVRVQDELHVFQAEAELPDVRGDLRRGLREAAIDEDVAFLRGDEDGGQRAAHVPGVAVDLERFASLA